MPHCNLQRLPPEWKWQPPGRWRQQPAPLRIPSSAVAAFLGRRIGFLDIAAIVEDTLSRYDPPAPQAIDDVFAIDREARLHAEAAMKVIVD